MENLIFCAVHCDIIIMHCIIIIIIVVVIIIIIIIVIIIVIIIITISFFKFDFCITFYNYKKPVNVNLPRKLEKNSDTKRFAKSLM